MDRTKLILSIILWFLSGSGIICFVGWLFSWQYETLISHMLNTGAFFAVVFGMVGYLIHKANHSGPKQ